MGFAHLLLRQHCVPLQLVDGLVGYDVLEPEAADADEEQNDPDDQHGSANDQRGPRRGQAIAVGERRNPRLKQDDSSVRASCASLRNSTVSCANRLPMMSGTERWGPEIAMVCSSGSAFRAKWAPIRVKKKRQTKKLEPSLA
jgi:hypothetical protein